MTTKSYEEKRDIAANEFVKVKWHEPYRARIECFQRGADWSRAEALRECEERIKELEGTLEDIVLLEATSAITAKSVAIQWVKEALADRSTDSGEGGNGKRCSHGVWLADRCFQCDPNTGIEERK